MNEAIPPSGYVDPKYSTASISLPDCFASPGTAPNVGACIQNAPCMPRGFWNFTRAAATP